MRLTPAAALPVGGVGLDIGSEPGLRTPWRSGARSPPAEQLQFTDLSGRPVDVWRQDLAFLQFDAGKR